MRTLSILAAASASLLALVASASEPDRLPLTDWRLQSSAVDRRNGETLSQPEAATEGWIAASVPTTVFGAQVGAGRFKDPYFGMNLRSVPGVSYPIGEEYANLDIPADSPYKRGWWFRTGFAIPADLAGRNLVLHFEGINYRADVWLNGKKVAASDEVVGAFRRYAFDVTAAARPGATNALAVLVAAPEAKDLGITWVDWNPTPPDKDMGLWGEVFLTSSGPLRLADPQVVTSLDLPSLDTAHVAISVEAVNTTDAPIAGVVRGTIESLRFEQPVSLKPRERARVRLAPEGKTAFDIAKPRLWWPYRMGAANLYTLGLEAEVGGRGSDRSTLRFGIRQATAEMTPEGHLVFAINGKRVLIRGGGWASDMLLRPDSERLAVEMRYVREMGLNTIRLEGKLERDDFYDMADERGILVMPGWCCCDFWEKWKDWDTRTRRIAVRSLEDQVRRLRNHASVFVWLNGSDNPPIKDVEQAYIDVLKRLEWPLPVVSSATEQLAPVSGPSGVKMRGPYEYVPPSYWLTDTKNGGAFGFATEISPGAAVPPLESLEQMLPKEHLWPIDAWWNFHAGGHEFKTIDRFTAALEARYGKATGVADYARKAQAITYDGERAMFEGYARNKYRSTGVIQWMLNNAWPSMIWHLYDYYLRPGGGYYGTKKACEPLHVQYSYDDASVAVVNDTQEPAADLTVSAEILDLSGASRWKETAKASVGADAVARALVVKPPPGLTTTYFLRLELVRAGGETVSTNTYWLSTQDDVLDAVGTKWFYTPTRRHADLTGLNALPPTRLLVELRHEGAETSVVRVRNAGDALAFQVHLRLAGPDGKEILPVYWDDNYLQLIPGESRELRVSTASGGSTTVTAEAWNAPKVEAR